jgi:succinate dehydrogenase hydrophobic anchor subunit
MSCHKIVTITTSLTPKMPEHPSAPQKVNSVHAQWPSNKIKQVALAALACWHLQRCRGTQSLEAKALPNQCCSLWLIEIAFVLHIGTRSRFVNNTFEHIKVQQLERWRKPWLNCLLLLHVFRAVFHAVFSAASATTGLASVDDWY